MTHGQVGFQLAHGIQHHAHHNEQAGTAEELGNHERNAELRVQHHREKRQGHQEHRPAESHPGHGGVQIFRRRRTGADTGDVSTFLLQIIRDLNGIELVGNPEIAECKDQQTVGHIVRQPVMLEPGGKPRPMQVTENVPGEHQNGTGKNDRHHVGEVDLQRHIGGTAGDLIAQFFGGTSLLIMVGVVLDTMRQLESHLTMRHYEGFLKSGRLRGRSN